MPIYRSMKDFDDEIDNLIEQVSFVEETIEFLAREVQKYGQTPEIKSRVIKEFSELRRLSNALKAFCDKYDIEDDDLTDESLGDTLGENE